MANQEQITQWIGNVNISETITDTASQGTIPQHDNLRAFKSVFGKYLDINPNITEENLIKAINRSKEVNWNEVSKNQNLTVDIMDEFSAKINWLVLIKNNSMTKKTIRQFREEINRVLNLRELVKAVSDDQEQVIVISILINTLYQDPAVMKEAIGKGNLAIVELLINNGVGIGTGGYLELAIGNGNLAIVELLIKNGVSIGTGSYLELAIQSGNSEMFDFFYDHPDNVRKSVGLINLAVDVNNWYVFNRMLIVENSATLQNLSTKLTRENKVEFLRVLPNHYLKKSESEIRLGINEELRSLGINITLDSLEEFI